MIDELVDLDDPDDPNDPNDFVGRIHRLEQQIAVLTDLDPNHPDLPALEEQLAALIVQRTTISNSIVFINKAKEDVLPYQTISTDVLIGQEGNDFLFGSSNVDRLIGGSGNDTIVHSAGDDFVFGGTDPIKDGTSIDSERDEYRVLGTQGDDVIVVELRQGADGSPEVFVTVNGVSTLASRLGIEVAGVDALGGNDQVTVEFGKNAGLPGGIDIHGGAGNDTLIAGPAADVPDSELAQTPVVIFGDDGNDAITGGKSKNFLDGGAGNDLITGGEIDDSIFGGDGDDTLIGGAGIDNIDGGAGNDSLDGGDQDDTLTGGAGNDSLAGGIRE